MWLGICFFEFCVVGCIFVTNEGDSLACLACGVDIGVGGSGKEVFIVDVACKKR